MVKVCLAVKLHCFHWGLTGWPLRFTLPVAAAAGVLGLCWQELLFVWSYCYVQCSGWLVVCACTSLGALWRGREMQQCCAEGAPQIKHGIIWKFLHWKHLKCWGLPLWNHRRKERCYLLVIALLNRNYKWFPLAVQRPSPVCPLQPFCMGLLRLNSIRGSISHFLADSVHVPVKPVMSCPGTSPYMSNTSQ